MAVQTQWGGLCQRYGCIYKTLCSQQLLIFLNILINILQYRTLNIAVLKLRDHIFFFAAFGGATVFKTNTIIQLEIYASVLHVWTTLPVIHITAFTPIQSVINLNRL